MMKKQQIDWRVLSIGIISIAALEAYALSQGVNGVALTAVIAVIAGVIGWTVPQLKLR